MRHRVLCVVGVAWFSGAALAGQSQDPRPVFRSGVEVVSVDVAVKSGNKPIAGLTAADFVVTDNGVIQAIGMASVETLPIDVTLLLDMSASVKGDMLVRLQAAVADTAKLLTGRDRLRLVVFSHILHEAFDFKTGGGVFVAADILPAGGGTSLYDALVAVMMKARPADRRHLIIAFTDGGDTLSFFNAAEAREVATLTDAVVHVVVGLDVPRVFSSARITLPAVVPNKKMLDDLTGATGGQVTSFRLTDSIGHAFKSVIDDFRTSYVLRYSPAGVARPGWHNISVTVKKAGSFDVRARKGYSGG